ncbi:hypothetical protein K0M31_017542 [Melipona bicolor]|uniref:Uncharacterized protein n=1 Tax=Melipona bicolor TaxID=60889 RepID=A0AA40G5S9_9HYME|nr:hypothetical protein K0M31_017542 [Melipona bicolor]
MKTVPWQHLVVNAPDQPESPADGLSIPTIVNATGFLCTTTTTTITTPPSPPPPPPPSSHAPSPTTTTTTTSIVGHYHGNRRMRILTSVQPTVSTCQVVQVLASGCCHPRPISSPRLTLPGQRIREYVRKELRQEREDRLGDRTSSTVHFIPRESRVSNGCYGRENGRVLKNSRAAVEGLRFMEPPHG